MYYWCTWIIHSLSLNLSTLSFRDQTGFSIEYYSVVKNTNTSQTKTLSNPLKIYSKTSATLHDSTNRQGHWPNGFVLFHWCLGSKGCDQTANRWSTMEVWHLTQVIKITAWLRCRYLIRKWVSHLFLRCALWMLSEQSQLHQQHCFRRAKKITFVSVKPKKLPPSLFSKPAWWWGRGHSLFTGSQQHLQLESWLDCSALW